ncbi:MAG: hypothetical protein ABEK04_05555 [Candidatus Nanohalobium sp.]
MEEALDLLTEFLDVEDLFDIGIGLIIMVLGLGLIAAGYFFNYSILDEAAIAIGIVTGLGGLAYSIYGVLLG